MASTTLGNSLYFHVPFCARKCDYCAFYSEATDGALMERYVDALIREIHLHLPNKARPKTLFFGGGTPSVLTLVQWEKIIMALKEHGVDGPPEWTIECNPATVSLEKARLWKEAGVNRISMGVQSLNEAMLDRLGRIHSRSMAFKSYDLLRQAGFDNINLDFMFAIPGQSKAVWEETLNEGLALGSEHLSCYELIYEEDTPLFDQLQAGDIELDEDLAAAMYEVLLEKTANAGFVQYEIANFARTQRLLNPSLLSPDASLPESGQSPSWPQVPDLACRHNINYWKGGSYMGLGPSASGFVGGVRQKNISNLEIYCQKLEAGDSPLDWQENLSPKARAGEIAAFGLRMNTGWSFQEFTQATGFDLRQEWLETMNELVSRGWGTRTENQFRLSAAGMRFADAAAEEFVVSGGKD